jgi:hypothetical protein
MRNKVIQILRKVADDIENDPHYQGLVYWDRFKPEGSEP